ncbi:MAG: hypothetical protein AAF264_02005 [Pseudomonadota bacterium]
MSLGIYDFQDGDTRVLIDTVGPNGNGQADAIRFELVSSPVGDPGYL